MPFSWALVGAGVVVTAVGEAIRFWGVHHIGTISRTRSERLGPLIDTGPFAYVRNPLYIGNILLWVGVALTARLVWFAPIAAVLLFAEYHQIVKWEEQLLRSRLGAAYSAYCARVSRWLPVPTRVEATSETSRDGVADMSEQGRNEVGADFSWSQTLFSERGTLIAIGVGYALLWLKSQV